MHGVSPNSLRAIMAGLGNISSPPVVILAGIVGGLPPTGEFVSLASPLAPPLNEYCSIVAGVAAPPRCRFVPAGVW